MVELNNLTKRFGDFVAVDNLNIKINEGEIFGLLGENGAGKTTTLRMLATMLKPTSGSATICTYDTIFDDEKVRSNIGILFGGETGLYDRLTARENIEYFGRLYDMTKEELNKQIDRSCEMLDMSEYIDKRIANFSKGMKQKTAFARSMIHNPKVLLLDEPTSGLDVTATKQVHQFIKTCKNEGKTIIFSSHSMSEVEKLCDRIAIIHKGKLITVDTIEGLKVKYASKNLEDIFTTLIESGSVK
ncbi:MAG: ATP-binding cassette domain-containing protein [Terrisporobacter sp.]